MVGTVITHLSALRKETLKLKHEIEETKAELETVTHASEAQLDGLERELEEKRKQFSSEIRYKDQRISILEQQLGYIAAIALSYS